MKKPVKGTAAGKGKSQIWKNIYRSRYLYLLFALPLLYFLVFKYGAMAWLSIAFFDYNAFLGFAGSKFVGIKYFKQFIMDPYFWNILKNTVVLNLWMLVLYFPTPIILALLINEVKNKHFKKMAQTISYMPYFLSTVVVCGFITTILSNDGLINHVISSLGLEKVQFLMEPGWFRPVYVISEIWQQCGWGSIIYLAALAGVDSQLYEAAAIDGAGKWKQLIHVSIPGIAPVISIQLLLTVGKLLTVGYEKILLLYTGATYSTADVISTYVYRRGLMEANYSYGSAVSIFQAVMALILVVLANKAARKVGQTSLW